MDNGGSPDVDQRSLSGQPDSNEDHQSANGHSPRPAGRSRSRFVFNQSNIKCKLTCLFRFLPIIEVTAILVVVIAEKVVHEVGHEEKAENSENIIF